jgi:hypothetical protein
MYKITPILVAALALLGACTPSRTITTRDGSVTITDKGKDDGSMHIAAKDGTSLDINTGKPITDYPSDVPLYAGKSVMDMKTEQKHARTVSIQTPDSVEKITEFYKSRLESNGWKTESTISTPQMTMYVATKDNRQMTVTIAAADDGKMQTVNQNLADK